MAGLGELAFGMVVSGVVLALGVWMMREAFRRREQRQLVVETPTEDVESLSMGQSEVKGVARPADAGTLSAPFSDEDALVAEWRIDEYDVDVDSDGDKSGRWHRKAQGVEHVPFSVDDGTGQVLVRPDDDVIYEIETGTEEETVIDVGETPPETILAFEEREGLGRPTGGERNFDRRDGDRRYSQNLLQPGEDAYVFGVVQAREGSRSAVNEENLEIRRVPEGDEDLEDMFMIGDRPEEEIVDDRRFALLWFPVGALLTTAGLGGLVVAGSASIGIQFL